MVTRCTHLDSMRDVSPNTTGCEEYLKLGDRWVHLCFMIWARGCRDSSKNKHATRHPIMRSIEPGEEWFWCYVDNIMLG
jgi:hypothetical protein